MQLLVHRELKTPYYLLSMS